MFYNNLYIGGEADPVAKISQIEDRTYNNKVFQVMFLCFTGDFMENIRHIVYNNRLFKRYLVNFIKVLTRSQAIE